LFISNMRSTRATTSSCRAPLENRRSISTSPRPFQVGRFGMKLTCNPASRSFFFNVLE
jgi:hypothetical protein